MYFSSLQYILHMDFTLYEKDPTPIRENIWLKHLLLTKNLHLPCILRPPPYLELNLKAGWTLSVFVYICPPHCERNSAHIVRTFPSSFRCVFDIVAHNVAGKSKILQYVGVRSFSQFLIIFIVHSIQFFIVSSKISKFLKLDQN